MYACGQIYKLNEVICPLAHLLRCIKGLKYDIKPLICRVYEPPILNTGRRNFVQFILSSILKKFNFIQNPHCLFLYQYVIRVVEVYILLVTPWNDCVLTCVSR